MERCLVLDLDGTLVSTSITCKKESCNHNTILFCSHELFVHTRPFVKEFFEWCQSNNQNIIIYSAASEDYVESIIKILDIPITPLAILTSKHLSSCQEPYRIFKTKTFDKINQIIQTNNLLAIDDSKDNFKGDNVIYVKEWSHEESDDVEMKNIIAKILDFEFNELEEDKWTDQ